MLQKASIKICSEITELEKFAEFFEDFGNQNQFTPKFINSLQIVFDELLSNTINYGLKGIENGFVKVDFVLGKKYLNVKITDNGTEFNPTLESNPDLDSSVENRKIGGLGIHIVKKMVDVFEYQRKDNLNIVTLKKKLI